MGIAAMTTAAPHTSAAKRLKLSDFMPHWDPEYRPEAQSAEDIMEAIRLLGKKDIGPSDVRDVHS